MRIVSLISSATEIVAALGLEAHLVGRSHECDFPASVERLPVVTKPRFETSATSAEIDRQVKSMAVRDPAREALGIYEVFPDLLRELNPTHILTQAQCEVCAVSLRDVEAAVREWTDCTAQIISLSPNTLSDVWDDFQRTGEALGAPDAAEDLIAHCRTRIAAVSSAVKDRPRPTVAVIEWADPLMAAGNWTPTLVDAAGGRNLYGEAGKHSPWMEPSDLIAADPEVIIVAPCGFSLDRARQALPLLERIPGWPDLQAVRGGRVAVVDGNQFFNRPGPRLADTVEISAEIFHPEAPLGTAQQANWERA